MLVSFSRYWLDHPGEFFRKDSAGRFHFRLYVPVIIFILVYGPRQSGQARGRISGLGALLFCICRGP